MVYTTTTNLHKTLY